MARSRIRPSCAGSEGLGLAVLHTPSQFAKRAAREAAEFCRCGIQLLGMIGVTGIERREPAAKSRQLIGCQSRYGFGDLFNFHAGDYSSFRPDPGATR